MCIDLRVLRERNPSNSYQENAPKWNSSTDAVGLVLCVLERGSNIRTLSLNVSFLGALFNTEVS